MYCSVNSSELSSLGKTKVVKWRNGFDSTQEVLTDTNTNSDVSYLNLQSTVGPNNSASNVSEVVSESNLQEVVNVSNNVSNIEVPTVTQNYYLGLVDLPINLIVDNVGGTNLEFYKQPITALF